MVAMVVNNKSFYFFLDETNVPLITNFTWDEMIHFIHNVDQTKRERYRSESKKVPCIQRKKSDDNKPKSKDSCPPVLEVILKFTFILSFHAFIL